MSDGGYRDQSEPDHARISRLEELAERYTPRQVVSRLQWGFTALLMGAGTAVLLFGVGYLVRSCSETGIAEARAEEELAHAQQLREQEPTDLARAECTQACGGANMRMGRVVLSRRNGTPRAVTCTCVSEHRTRVLWDERQSPNARLRAECAQACDAAGMRIQRAVLGDSPNDHADGLVVLACGCVSEGRHRTLWDDRRDPRCIIKNGDCSLEDLAAP